MQSLSFQGPGRLGNAQRRSVVTGVATPSRPPTAYTAKRSKVELIKEKSDYLRHPLMQELVTEASNISEEAVQLMKFHGSYQQDDREKRSFGSGKLYQFMMRTKQPSGLVTNKLYLVMDELANLVRMAGPPCGDFWGGDGFVFIVCRVGVRCGGWNWGEGMTAWCWEAPCFPARFVEGLGRAHRPGLRCPCRRRRHASDGAAPA